MALRYAAGDECWRPCKAHASIIIDDPLLRKSYGFLNFDFLLGFAERHNFHTTIAFIPHNFRRNLSRTTRMFQENASRLSICFHGNDHTKGEFASTDMAFLNTSLRIAEDRMTLHQQMTGLPCDSVMVFPQGNFSIEAMKVLKSHNFYAAVNTVPHPAEQPVRLTIGELAQPAVLRYGGLPLFICKPIRQTQSHDIAFNVFFGQPVLIVEHHEIFQHPESLVEIAAKESTLWRRQYIGLTLRPWSATHFSREERPTARTMFVLFRVLCEFRTTRIPPGVIRSNGVVLAMALRLSKCLWMERPAAHLRSIMPAPGSTWN